MASGDHSHPGTAATTARAKVYWLDAPHGRVPIGAAAVLIGRSPDCAIILDQPDVSRHHLLVRLSEQGVEMLPLGRLPVLLNGKECSALTALRAGDEIDLHGWSFRVGEGEAEETAHVRDVVWCLERQSGLLHLVTGPSFRVGGGADDDLIVAGWEPAVLSLRPHAEGPTLTALRPGVSSERPLGEGERVALADGARFTYRGESFVVRAKGAHAEAVTVPSERTARATVVLEFLPRGGRLTIESGGKLQTTMLSDRRCDLVACLLRPPAPYQAGDFVPEDTLCARIWPGENNGRTELNSLLYRLRQNLADEGIDPAPLFDRTGGGLRFCLPEGARVVVR